MATTATTETILLFKNMIGLWKHLDFDFYDVAELDIIPDEQAYHDAQAAYSALLSQLVTLDKYDALQLWLQYAPVKRPFPSVLFK